MIHFSRVLLFLTLVTYLTACSGGGSSSSSGAPATSSSQAGSCSQSSQKTWVRSHLDDVYLWYSEIVDVNPDAYSLAPDYFSALLVRSRDRFSYSMPETTANALFQEGQDIGYGPRWGWGAPGRLFIFYVDPASPAASVLSRGHEVLAVNGTDLAQVSTDALNAALFPDQEGVSLTLKIRRLDGSVFTTTLASARYLTTTVGQPLVFNLSNGRKAGYLLFNEHLATSETGLINALSSLQHQGVAEVVLDMRYNGGGYLYIAEEVASMLGGTAVQGKLFERLLFNDKHPEMTNDPDNSMYFSTDSRGGTQLPQLGLQRVFVLTGSSTCSASESVINGLLPFVQVVRVGATTCGKPYGFMQANNCQQAYFAIRFQGVNAQGRADYPTGFSPTCQVSDDLTHSLGDPNEARLSAALYYMINNRCPFGKSVPLPVLGNTEIEAEMLSTRPALKIIQ